MVEAINADFVPVWINTRAEPVPEFPDREEVLMGARLNRKGKLGGAAAQGFFLRVVVLDPADLRLLNRQAPTAEASVGTFLREGHFAYAQARADDLLPMMASALEAYRSR